MVKEVPPDTLAERYATPDMIAIWSPAGKTLLLRELWIAVLKGQKALGLPVPDSAIEAYERVKYIVNRDSITARELRLRHDVMAEIEEFNELAGGIQYIHRGLTSRDETDNVEQLQILESMRLVRNHAVAIMKRLKRPALEFRLLDMCGRSHNVPGQAITLGKRFSNITQEFLIAFEDLETFITHYPLRGIKGPMGTQADMVAILKSPENTAALERVVRDHLGFSRVLESVGQVYPRSLDFMAISRLAALSSAMGNFAKMIRLMAGNELAHEGFKGEQAGSSAMPHKINSRTCERINGLVNVLCGFLDMLSRLLGDQWYEGDVSCSVVRRVALPGAFYAIDGLFEAAMHVLDEMEIFPGMIEAELFRFFPFISSTALLRMGVEKGLGREDAHTIIKKAVLRSLPHMREGHPNPFFALLAEDEHFPLMETVLLMNKADHGRSPEQIDAICAQIDTVLARYPEAADYIPQELR